MKLRLGVVVATHGRGDFLTHLLRHLKVQTRQPDLICVSAVVEGDVDAVDRMSDLPIKIVLGEAGLAAQRNRGVRALVNDVDVIIFFDDDFFPARSWLQHVEKIFLDHPSIVGVDGRTLADGALGGGLDLADAEQMLAKFDTGTASADWSMAPHGGLYGCNMAFRASVFATIEFDERLPLYSWLEDYDLSIRARTIGRVVRSEALWGVHLGVKRGKTSGVRFGASQVVNPIYLYRKGTIGFRKMARMIVRPVLKNLLRAPYPEPYIDRRGRLRGNLIGIASILRGRIDPRIILEL
jgi:GT2 family glycosyltransferase